MGAAVCRILWIPSSLAVVAMVIVFARQPLVLPPPEAMTGYTTEDKMLEMQHPSNWKPHSNAVAGAATDLWFIPVRNAKIYVKADLFGSLMGDIAKGPAVDLGGAEGNLPGAEAVQKKTNRPLAAVHDMKGEEYKKEYRDYEESGTHDSTLGGMEALVSPFTFEVSALWGSKEMVGVRMSALANDRRISLIYYCPKDMQATLEPIYKKMLTTFKYTSI